jgi:hypothetical protein
MFPETSQSQPATLTDKASIVDSGVIPMSVSASIVIVFSRVETRTLNSSDISLDSIGRKIILITGNGRKRPSVTALRFQAPQKLGFTPFDNPLILSFLQWEIAQINFQLSCVRVRHESWMHLNG